MVPWQLVGCNNHQPLDLKEHSVVLELKPFAVAFIIFQLPFMLIVLAIVAVIIVLGRSRLLQMLRHVAVIVAIAISQMLPSILRLIFAIRFITIDFIIEQVVL